MAVHIGQKILLVDAEDEVGPQSQNYCTGWARRLHPLVRYPRCTVGCLAARESPVNLDEIVPKEPRRGKLHLMISSGPQLLQNTSPASGQKTGMP